MKTLIVPVFEAVEANELASLYELNNQLPIEFRPPIDLIEGDLCQVVEATGQLLRIVRNGKVVFRDE